MEMSADHSTTEPTDNSADTDQSKTESDRAETADELSQLEDRWRRAVADSGTTCASDTPKIWTVNAPRK